MVALLPEQLEGQTTLGLSLRGGFTGAATDPRKYTSEARSANEKAQEACEFRQASR